jgi:DNA-binding FadR family transcriptional regulator
MIEPGSLIRSLSGRPAARNFHSFVINEIGHGIVSGAMAVGSTLASDAAMMESYGVSRTVLREALKTLESKGLVEARPKVGTRVSPQSRWNYFDPQVLSWHFHAPLQPGFLEGLFEVREPLEAQAAVRASRFRTAEHVRILKYWLHQMANAGEDVEQYALAALEVHRVLADSSRNALLRSVLGVVELTLALAASAHGPVLNADYAKASLLAHQALIDAVEAGAELEGQKAMLDCIAIDRDAALSASV